MLQLFLSIAGVVVTGNKLIASIFIINENPGQGKNVEIDLFKKYESKNLVADSHKLSFMSYPCLLIILKGFYLMLVFEIPNAHMLMAILLNANFL
jgi:hypothetical protein